MLSAEIVATHCSRESCWIIVSGNVYDVTEFLDDHPGGSAIILRYAGRDATEAYEPIHPPMALTDNLPKEKCLGPVDPNTLTTETSRSPSSIAKEKASLPPLGNMISLLDFEVSLISKRSAFILTCISSGSGQRKHYSESMGLFFLGSDGFGK